MTDRDQLLTIRPEIPGITSEGETSAPERFQNLVLRPILKLQNDLILLIYQNYLQKRKGKFYQLNQPGKLKYIEETIRKDLKFRNLMTGLVIGQMTNSEWATYSKSEKELSRRIATLLTQRLQHQLDQL